MLTPITIPTTVDETPIPPAVERGIVESCRRIEAFQDRWGRDGIEQFVAADFRLVYQTLDWVFRERLSIGRSFLEWGCGFAVVSAIAETLGCRATGIEAERELLRRGRETLDEWGVDGELVHGNFLPPGAEVLADDTSLPSLGHPVECGYETLGLDLDDFAIVYDYPWPGEESFHERVFDRYAGVGGLLMLFCGPYDIRLWRKVA